MKNATKWLLILLTVVAAVLRLYGLGSESFWGDELLQIQTASLPWWESIKGVIRFLGSAPLDYFLTHWLLYIGKTEAFLRLPAAIWGTLAVPALFFLGRELFDEVVGLAAAALLAFTPIHIYYSQELRFYSLATFLFLMLVLLFVRAVNENTLSKWFLYGLVTATALYTSFYAGLVVSALGLWILWWRRDRLWSFMAASGGSVLLFSPWVAYYVANAGGLNARSEQFEFVPPTASRFVTGLFVLNTYPGSYWRYQNWPTILALLLATSVGLLLWRQREKLASYGLVLLVAVVGFSGVLVLDALGSYFFVARQTVVFIPFFQLLIVSVLQTISRRYQVVAAVSLVAVFAVLNWPDINGSYATIEKQDFRGAARYLAFRMNEGDVLFTNRPWFLTFYVPELETRMYGGSTNPKVMVEYVRRLRSEGHIAWFMPIRLPNEYNLIFQTWQRQGVPFFKSPRIYAIPRPGNW